MVGRCWRAPQVRERVGGEGVERVDADAGGQVAGAIVAKEAGHPGQPGQRGRWRSLQGEGVGRGTRGLASSKSRSHTSSSSKSSTSLTSSTSTCSPSCQLRYGVDDGHGLHVPRVPLHPVSILSHYHLQKNRGERDEIQQRLHEIPPTPRFPCPLPSPVNGAPRPLMRSPTTTSTKIGSHPEAAQGST